MCRAWPSISAGADTNAPAAVRSTDLWRSRCRELWIGCTQNLQFPRTGWRRLRCEKLFLDRLRYGVINHPVPNWSAFHTGQELIRNVVDLSDRGLNEEGSALASVRMP